MRGSRITTGVLVALAVALAALGAGCEAEVTEPVAEETTTPPPSAPEEPPSAEPLPLEEIEIALEPVLDGFSQPLYVTGAGDGSGRLFVAEKTGLIWTLENGERTEVYLDLTGVVSTESEQGLLGMAFPPGFTDGEDQVWVSYTRADGSSVVSSFASDGVLDPASEQVWLTVEQPYANHNGGMIEFGPDGYLYVGLGDGGSGGDPHGNGQNTLTLLGSMLRIDVKADTDDPRPPYTVPADNPLVGQPDVRPEIWASGLRNPWRFSFDRVTGDMWIGDVGQNAWEEIDFQPASSGGGENYGWKVFEGTHPYPHDAEPPAPDGFTMPVVEYDRDAGTSVTGGYVYRGEDQPALRGTYLYGDFSVGRIWGLQQEVDGSVRTRLLLDTDMMISSFGEDDDGELYVVDFNGAIHHVVTQ